MRIPGVTGLRAAATTATRTPIVRRVAIVAVAVIGLCFSPGLVAQDTAAIGARRVIFRRQLDALRRPHGTLDFALSPDGRRLLYYQGLPWPRLMVVDVDSPHASPRMIGALEPFGALPPRFGASGDEVFFTVVDGTAAHSARAISPTRASAVDLPLVVVRADIASGRSARLHPASTRGGAFSVLLDVHPSGERILVGTGRGFRGPDLRAAPTALTLVEVPARGGSDSRPGFQVMSDALVRYSRDGASIEYTQGAGDEPEVERARFDLASARHVELGPATLAEWRPAGDHDVRAIERVHRGSFGYDGVSSYAVRRTVDGVTHVAELDVASALAGLPIVPIAFAGGRALVAGGPRDRPTLAVVELEVGAGAALVAETDVTRFAVGADFFRGGIACRSDPKAAAILERVRRALTPTAAKSGVAARAEARRTKSLGATTLSFTITATEALDGRFRVERQFPPVAVDSSDGRAATGESTVSYARGRGSIRSAGDARQPVDAGFLARTLAESSPLRLWLDPAGLADRDLRFLAPRDAASGRDTAATAAGVVLPFEYDDGFAGELSLEAGERGLLPREWRTRLSFPTHALATQIGAVRAHKTLRFEEWRDVDGRLVPARIYFDDGIAWFELELLALDVLAELPAELEAGDGDR